MDTALVEPVIPAAENKSSQPSSVTVPWTFDMNMNSLKPVDNSVGHFSSGTFSTER